MVGQLACPTSLSRRGLLRLELGIGLHFAVKWGGSLRDRRRR
jgi:hypothetical protein